LLDSLLGAAGAKLVAQGLSNKEIDQRLYLSPRTVGSHLYRILPKLKHNVPHGARERIWTGRKSVNPDDGAAAAASAVSGLGEEAEVSASQGGRVLQRDVVTGFRYDRGTDVGCDPA
jgi:hypothetical protein